MVYAVPQVQFTLIVIIIICCVVSSMLCSGASTVVGTTLHPCGNKKFYSAEPALLCQSTSWEDTRCTTCNAILVGEAARQIG
jgi:hypothetical protein